MVAGMRPYTTVSTLSMVAIMRPVLFHESKKSLPCPSQLPAKPFHGILSPRVSSTRLSATHGKYAELLQGSQEAQDEMHWSAATVVENKAASADGSVRTLVLSVSDAVVFGDGRRVKHVQENRRCLDNYRVPGQFVAIRYRKDGGNMDPWILARR